MTSSISPDSSESNSNGRSSSRPSADLASRAAVESQNELVSSSEKLSETSGSDVTDVVLDMQRQGRCGFPEAIFGEGKSTEQLLQIAKQQLEAGISVFITRIAAQSAADLAQVFAAHYNELAQTVLIPCLQDSDAAQSTPQDRGFVPVVSAGTTDRPVVEEALETLKWMGISTTRVMDVGVAGPHRFPERIHQIAGADAIIVVAGMEGALPSIVAGYVDCPVIAVPTSVGYGANLGGISALLSMLNSCAANVSVVNIDAGFKGAYVAGLIASRAHNNRSNKGTGEKTIGEKDSLLDGYSEVESIKNPS